MLPSAALFAHGARKALGVLGLSLLAACGTPDPSTAFPTDHIYARFVAETGADGTSEVRADFFEKDELFNYESVYLAGGDALDVRTHEQHLLFKGGGTHFEGQLASGVLEDTRFEFDLERPQRRDAPNSWGTLPAPMDLLLPDQGTEYSIANDPVNVAWTQAGTLDDMWIGVDVHCALPQENSWITWEFEVGVTGDPGAASFNASDYMFFNDACQRFEGTLKLYRARAGVLDDAYKPDEAACGDDHSGDCSQRGYVSVRQVRSVDIVLKP